LILIGTCATESVQYWCYLVHVQHRECAISILFGTYGIQDLNW